jgi:hypothetical protein
MRYSRKENRKMKKVFLLGVMLITLATYAESPENNYILDGMNTSEPAFSGSGSSFSLPRDHLVLALSDLDSPAILILDEHYKTKCGSRPS